MFSRQLVRPSVQFTAGWQDGELEIVTALLRVVCWGSIALVRGRGHCVVSVSLN